MRSVSDGWVVFRVVVADGVVVGFWIHVVKERGAMVVWMFFLEVVVLAVVVGVALLSEEDFFFIQLLEVNFSAGMKAVSDFCSRLVWGEGDVFVRVCCFMYTRFPGDEKKENAGPPTLR